MTKQYRRAIVATAQKTLRYGHLHQNKVKELVSKGLNHRAYQETLRAKEKLDSFNRSRDRLCQISYETHLLVEFYSNMFYSTSKIQRND